MPVSECCKTSARFIPVVSGFKTGADDVSVDKNKKRRKEILVFCRWHRSFPPLESLKTVVVFKNKAKLYTKWDLKKKVRAPAKTTCLSRWSTARNHQEDLLIFNICCEVCWEGCGSHHSVQCSDSLTDSVQREEEDFRFIGWPLMLFSLRLDYLLSISSSLLVVISWLTSVFFFSLWYKSAC